MLSVFQVKSILICYEECVCVFVCKIVKFANELHPEKCFVESTKIWLAQQSFSFKYGPMENFVDSTKFLLIQ